MLLAVQGYFNISSFKYFLGSVCMVTPNIGSSQPDFITVLVQFLQAGSPPICEIIDFKITHLASEELTMQIVDITCTVNKKSLSVNTGNICDLRNELFSRIRWII
jgi:hypothetical protein